MIAAFTAAILLSQPDNTLTPHEKSQGWKLLFDGQTTKGWTTYHGRRTPGAGWQVKDGILSIVDPGAAGDIVTEEKYQWFNLKVDFRVEPGQNSGIIFHVQDKDGEMWHSGPEVQIYDHHNEPGAQKTGFLYDLYSCDREAAKPAGEWNHLVLHISKKKCTTTLNGILMYTFQLGSEDFKARVAKSKFSGYSDFGTLEAGRIGLQGDHGRVSFRNVKIRALKG